MTPLAPPDSYIKGVMAKKHKFLRFLTVFLDYFHEKCISGPEMFVLATKIRLLQQKILLVAQHGIGELRLSRQKFCCFS